MKKLLAVCFVALFSVSAFAVDTDGDGVDDSIDAFPNYPDATTDTDGDGKPDVVNLNNPVFADSFESGNFTDGGWALGGTMSGTPWTIYNVGGSNGKVAKLSQLNSCFMSTCKTAYIQKTVVVPSGGAVVSFNLKGWVGFDFGPAEFYIDGILNQQWTSLNNWTPVTKTLSAGMHVLKWQTSGGFATTGYVYVDAVIVTGTSSLVQDMDDDNDGMPDVWETTYGFNPLVNDAAGDLDSDGFTNLQEYTNSTDPTVSNNIAASVKNDYTNGGIAGWIWKGQSNGYETVSQIWQLTFPLVSPNYGVPNRFYPPPFPDQANWEIMTSGDFNKDGDADIVWRNNSTAQWKIWQMQNGTRVAQNAPADFDLAHEWQVIGAGDTDKDGDDDIILNNATTGEVLVWQMQDHAIAATHAIGSKAGYTLNRIGDFNKDGDVDLLFRQNGTDVLITWELQANAFVAERALANTGTGYSPVCAGDFDNDNDDDIMLVNSATTQEKWFVMENYARTQTFGASNTGFVFKGCGDYDGDGDADSLWQRSADDVNRVVLQQNYGASKQTVYTNAFGGVNPGAAGYGFVYRGNSN